MPKQRINTEAEDLRKEILAALPKGVYAGMCHIPLGYRNMTAENYRGDISKIITGLHQGLNITLLGVCGTGKTHIAVALIYEWLKKNITVKKTFDEFLMEESFSVKPTNNLEVPMFLPADVLYLELRSVIGTFQTEDVIYLRYTKYPLLVLDDIASEKITEAKREALYIILERRNREGKQTIATSNKSLNCISSEIDDRIASRLSKGMVITLEGEDNRLKQAKINNLHFKLQTKEK